MNEQKQFLWSSVGIWCALAQHSYATNIFRKSIAFIQIKNKTGQTNSHTEIENEMFQLNFFDGNKIKQCNCFRFLFHKIFIAQRCIRFRCPHRRHSQFQLFQAKGVIEWFGNPIQSFHLYLLHLPNTSIEFQRHFTEHTHAQRENIESLFKIILIIL